MIGFVERPYVHGRTLVIPRLGAVEFGDLAGGDVTEGLIELIYVDMRRAQVVEAGIEARNIVRVGLGDTIRWLRSRGVEA